MSFKLYEFAVTRSSRVRFTLLELGISFESIEGPEAFKHPDVAEIHPLKKQTKALLRNQANGPARCTISGRRSC